MGAAAEWHAFLDEFRSLGGRAENVMQRKGKLGMGIFPIDPSKPVDLFIPSALLVPKDNVELLDGNVVIKDTQNFPQGYSDWFRKYQDAYSWGAEGREQTLAFEKGLKELPKNIKDLLKSYGLFDPDGRFPEEDLDNEILQRFLLTRCINYQGVTNIMPMIDLVNHSPAAKNYDVSNDGIAIGGMHEGEVLVRYNIMDPIRRFFGYGFNSQESNGYSLRCRIQHKDVLVIVQGGQSERPLQPCKVTFKEDRFLVQQPLLGSMRTPRLPRTLFLQACKDFEQIDANELFDQIQQSNTLSLIKLLRELNQIESEIATSLRICCLDQMAAQSLYFGERKNEVTN